MTALDRLLAEIDGRAITLYRRGDQLRYRAKAGSMTPALRAGLAERREELIQWCRKADAALDRALDDEYRHAMGKGQREAEDVARSKVRAADAPTAQAAAVARVLAGTAA